MEPLAMSSRLLVLGVFALTAGCGTAPEHVQHSASQEEAPFVLHDNCDGPAVLGEAADDPLAQLVGLKEGNAQPSACGTELMIGVTPWLRIGSPPADAPCSELPDVEAFLGGEAECFSEDDPRCFTAQLEAGHFTLFPTSPSTLLEVRPTESVALLWQWDAGRSCAVSTELVRMAPLEPTKDDVPSVCDEDVNPEGSARVGHTSNPAGQWTTVEFDGVCQDNYDGEMERTETELGATIECERMVDSGSELFAQRWIYQAPGHPPVAVAHFEYAYNDFHDSDHHCDLVYDHFRPADEAPMIRVAGDTFAMGTSDLEKRAGQCTEQGGTRCTPDRFKRESPAHSVVVKDFLMDQHEVSIEQYQRCVDSGTCSALAGANCLLQGGAEGKRGVSDLLDNPRLPARCVTFTEAQAYCAWAGGRLPTEAEWELAAWRYTEPDMISDARAGVRSPHSVHKNAMAWTMLPTSTGKEEFPERPLLNLLGNVYEWVDGASCAYADWPEGAPRYDTGDKKVVRGGGFTSDAGALTPTYRRFNAPETRADTHGFRCASDVSP